LNNGWTFFGHDLGVLVMLPAMACHTREFLKNHYCGEYQQRFEKFAETNSELYLNDVYRDDGPDCVGEFALNQFILVIVFQIRSVDVIKKKRHH
jgi:hypothetical protein